MSGVHETDPGSSGPAAVADIDPFEFTYLFPRRLKQARTSTIALLTLVLPTLVILVTAIEGTLGSRSDYRLADDMAAILGQNGGAGSLPDFPLARDVYSWTQAMAVMAGTVLLHKQWHAVSRTISGLRRSGALRDRKAALVQNPDTHSAALATSTTPARRKVERLLFIADIAETSETNSQVDAFLNRLMENLKRPRWRTGLLTFQLTASALLAFLLVSGQQASIFDVLAPESLSSAQRSEWTAMAYDSWWAGSEHVLGYVTYYVVAVYAIFVILNFQTVGLIIAYCFLCVFLLSSPGADWLNEDRHWGWQPSSDMYRTVLLANLLLAFTLTDVLLFIGSSNFAWILGLVGLYVILLPIFVFVPWAVTRSVSRRVKRERIEEILRGARNEGVEPANVPLFAAYSLESDRCRAASIRPLSLRRAEAYPLFTLLVLPLVIAIAQTVFQLQTGG